MDLEAKAREPSASRRTLGMQSFLDDLARLEKLVSGKDWSQICDLKTKGEALGVTCTAIIDEAGELRDCTFWEWWTEQGKDPSLRGAMRDVDAAKEELIDILHFWLRAALILGMDGAEIARVFDLKFAKNVHRQRAGYRVEPDGTKTTGNKET